MSQQIIVLSMDDRKSPASHKLQLATLFEQWARKERVQRSLRRTGLDPMQFALLLELFRTVSGREEIAGGIGVNRFNIAYISYWSALMSAYILAFLIFRRAVPNAPIYLLINLSLTFAVIFLVFIREAANSLFNPDEAAMLAHTPVHGPTYAAAKIVHVFISVLYLVLGLNVVPAFVGCVVSPGARWFWFITHLASAFLVGLWTAFIICAVYGFMRRLLPADHLKIISRLLQVISMVAFVVIPFFYTSVLLDFLSAGFANSRWTWLPLVWFLELGRMGCQGTSWQLGLQGGLLIPGSIPFIWLGLRGFCGSYLLEVAAGDVRRAKKDSGRGVLYRCLTALPCAIAGSAATLGAFFFVSQMLKRDRLFWRAVLTQTWILLLFSALTIAALLHSGVYPAAHIFPHLLGLIIIAVCLNLPTTLYSCASWIYLTVPFDDGRAFAGAIAGALWVWLAMLPQLALFVLITISANSRLAASVTGFNLLVVSLYLAFGIGMISGLPFSCPPNESRNMVKSIYIQICGLMTIVLPVVVQINIWLRQRYILPAATYMCFGVLFVLYVNLKGLEREILWRKYLLKMGPKQLFREFE